MWFWDVGLHSPMLSKGATSSLSERHTNKRSVEIVGQPEGAGRQLMKKDKR
jgi:hypothetical protein